ncbi:MAG: type II and III secretion system protein family protein [Hyphomicrobiaceae bacterium]|nr:type II and III secretion system protein family protein [Hyphomicrobiaceae bacterium]
MRELFLWRTALRGAALLAALVLSASQVPPAEAGSGSRQGYEPGSSWGRHRSFMTIPPGADLPITRKLSIGIDKSMLIELPTDVTDVLVSNPEVVDAVVQTPRRLYLLAKDVGEANAFFMGPGGQKVLLLELTVIRDLAALEDMLAKLIPGSKITVTTVANNVALTGSVLSPADASRASELAGRFVKNKDGVANMLSVATKEQVLLKIKVAEVQREGLKRIGVDLPKALLNSGDFTFHKVITNAFPVTSPAVPLGVAGSTLASTWKRGNQEVQLLMEALERTGLVRTLAEPSLTALSGETAKFLAGGEFPIPIASTDKQVTITFKQFGVSTSFKPVVLDQGRISLNIQAEVSELSTEGAVTVTDQITVPALKVRRAETTLEMPSGGTLAMAGLLSDETRQNVDGVPGLKSVPILGALFRSNDFRRRETELVILVTPYLATHMQPDQGASPEQYLMPASDLRSLFFGHLNRIYGRPGAKPKGRYEGQPGFIIEYPDPGVKG